MDLIVAVVCIALLVALVVPLIYSWRMASRREACVSHVRDLTQATLAHAALDGERLPLLEDGRAGWPAMLLVHLRLPEVADEVARGELQAARQRRIPVFTCPFDGDSFGQPGGLSYAGNGGYGRFEQHPQSRSISEIGRHSPRTDLDGDGEVSPEEYAINFATGVFWRETPGGRRMTLAYIRDHDGLAQTMLLTENIDAGAWSSTDTMDIAFVIGRDALGLDANPVGPEALKLDPGRVELGLFAPHSQPGRPAGRSPVPGSLHDETLHVGFCDGSVRRMSLRIDPLVYARLMTPGGTLYGQAGAQRE